ncbi:MAG: double zinc ribbon domain-containing protein [Psychromonas sp.]
MIQLTQQTFKRLIDRLLPTQCLLCKLSSHNKLICTDCQNALIKPRSCCLCCGLPLTRSLAFCGDCLKKKHKFTRLHAISDYLPPYPGIIKKFKYSKQLIQGELLGELLVQSLKLNLSTQQIDDVDYLLAVPLHTKKLRQRGFNQAQLIANIIAKQLDILMLPDLVNRHKATHVQENLTAVQRKRNLDKAFSINLAQKDKLTDAYIVIIDDVVTTGATANSLCQTLLDAGARRVDIWCICRTNLINKK